jgi:hypothetical protein
MPNFIAIIVTLDALKKAYTSKKIIKMFENKDVSQILLKYTKVKTNEKTNSADKSLEKNSKKKNEMKSQEKLLQNNENLNQLTGKYPDKSLNKLNIPIKNTKDYHYIVNHTKKQYVDKRKQKLYHPLPLLTAEGNGRGGGDFKGKGEELIGTWARDVLSVEKVIPDNYTELICEFQEE